MTQSDFITVTGIRVQAHHGVFAHERQDGQEFVVDVTVWTDLARAGTSDDLSDTVHYGVLAQHAYDAVASSPVDLIETVSECVAQAALAFPAVTRTRVTLHKPHAPIEVPFDDVSVTIERERS